ncbi:MAG: hypothetical protein CFE26_07085 [Verrucomicrobiales bacterium VVV1]|nr:MAG: hypothetical protein CFE26_07085 [Verrucomicrobiales bacterium VVV1]
MKRYLTLALSLFLALSASAQIKRAERKSLLDQDPDVVYFEEESKKPIMLGVIKEAPVYSDKEGKVKLGYLKADQTVRLEAMTDRAYKVRGKGTSDGISGWVPPWAFSSKDPKFVENLKLLYARNLQVQKLIDAHQVAVGLTMEEVTKSLGTPTKTTMRKTGEGQSGRWEFIDYEEVKNYANVRDPATGQIFRQLISVTQIEKGKTAVEFENGMVSAVEESEDRQKSNNTRIIVPPLVWGW